MATYISGNYIDPSGNTFELKALNEREYAALVARKLKQGWKPAPGTMPPATHAPVETAGVFVDPSGLRITLRGATPEEFEALVMRKLEQGWKPVGEPAVDFVKIITDA